MELFCLNIFQRQSSQHRGETHIDVFIRTMIKHFCFQQGSSVNEGGSDYNEATLLLSPEIIHHWQQRCVSLWARLIRSMQPEQGY